ncbi:OmpA family protein [Altererythrobacter sp. FM1]|uniref:OmpA family protein n=1 Tax=Tsuneonella flava TaxID=2055955 RepID=A0ABX7KCS2_9SPHN|nr:OmpA family protein [Tsuneonella flava]QSB44851.1 OmpA family protein [Tsuneonella flava]ROT96572.1 OmpA family protein [Altererythrobacter sp. FM1]
MNVISRTSGALPLIALVAMAASAPLAAQPVSYDEGGEPATTVIGTPPADLSELEAGPEINGIITARDNTRFKVTAEDGTDTVLYISDASEIRSSGGFLGLARDKLGSEALLNGLPVSVETKQWASGLVASKIALKSKDLKTAQMIHSGTAQGFAEQTAATEALRGRMGDIDKYNVKGTTNVYFDTGKWKLTPEAERDLCAAASQAEAMDNALLLVVGYTDSDGSQEFNQTLSEKRAGRVVNYLQQNCGWKPYRMLTPTGMAEADPAADNTTAYGKAQNRRVSVNILVSKGLDGI